MAYIIYRGTKITGTSTTPKVFPHSGVSVANKNDEYQNTSSGHLYQCTDAGSKYEYHKTKDKEIKSGKDYYTKSGGSYHKVNNPKKSDLKKYYERKTIHGTADIAKWKYVKTNIVKKPSVCVSNLGAPVRVSGTHKMEANWKTPNAMISKEKGDRATGLEITWALGIKGKDPKILYQKTNEKLVKSTINLNNLTLGNKTYTRESFYPISGTKLNYVSVKVVSTNDFGNSPSAKNTREFTTPKKPTLSAFTFNEVGEASCTITADAGDGYAERYDTQYRMTVYRSDTKKTETIYPNANDTGKTTSTSKTIKFDDRNYAARQYGDYAKVTVYAKTRGYAGDSEVVEKSFYIAYPKKPEITSVSVSDYTSSGKATIYITPNSKTEFPVDRIKLEVLANCEYATESQIPAGAGWEQTDIIDDAQCKAMAISVGALMPERGNYTWIRLKSYHANETVLYTYSKPFRIKSLETPAATAADDKIKILSATAGGDGNSAIVQLAWNDGELPSTGTELTWDTDVNAWKSTKAPQDYEFTWSDGTTTIDGETWKTATISIKDLDEGAKYYIRARRYNEGDETTYSAYSNTATVITSQKPESVSAVADRYVPKGSGLNVYWTFAGNAIQKEWQIVKGANTIIANGAGSVSSIQIPANKLESKAVNGNLTFTVQVSTGSGWVVSDPLTVTIIDTPTLSVNAPSVMMSQPFEFTAVASVPSDLIVLVTSQGSTGQFPQGIMRQTAGDTIHSDVYVANWISGYALTQDTEYGDKTYYEKDGNKYIAVIPTSEGGIVDPSINPQEEGWYETITGVSTTVTLPIGLDFWDKGSYTLSVVAVDRQTKLRSEPVVSDFSVAWSHQAPSAEPTEVYTLSEDTEVNDNKNYYSYDSTTQVYTVVITEGSENPTEEGWYERTVTEYVTLTPVDSVDESGYHHMAVQINLLPPPNSVGSDVYDIYRVTGDGARLIGQSFPLTLTVTDEYAPYSASGANVYRIATRTADGDVAFSDFGYVLEGDGIRLDWQGGFIEYPYGVDISDSYQKDVDIRKHLDGSINGYWNEGIERKGSLNTDVIKIVQDKDIDLTRQLGRYTGAVFVRTKEGTAFEADVQISNIATKNPAIMSIGIDATEIDLTDEFMLPTPFELQSEEQEG